MNIMEGLTWIGTVVSIIGAGISIWQAIKSKSAATEACRIRSLLIDHRETSELSQIQASCRKAQKSMEKYGPGSVADNLHGISPANDARDVQEFVLYLREQRDHFGRNPPNEVDNLCDLLLPLLDEFAQAADPMMLRDKGKQIVIHLSGFSSVIKLRLDQKREAIR